MSQEKSTTEEEDGDDRTPAVNDPPSDGEDGTGDSQTQSRSTATGRAYGESGSEGGSSWDSADVEGVPFSSKPTIRPTLVWLLLTVLIGGGAVLYVQSNSQSFEPGQVRLATQVLALLTILGVIRFVVRILILRRTTYIIEGGAITREYSLLMRVEEREVPVDMVRSYEVEQSRIQRLFGYGTIALNQGLGSIRLENVPAPHEVKSTVGQLVEQEKSKE